MARIKRGIISRRKHVKLRKLAKGYRGSNRRLIKNTTQAVLHAGAYSFAGRKNRKRDFRSLWIIRINEAVKKEGLSYSIFMNKLKKINVGLDRKILSDLVVNDPTAFKHIVDSVKNV